MPVAAGYFLCGCDPKDPHVKNYSLELVRVPGIVEPVLSGKRYDKHGNEICPIHGEHLYGWRTPLKTGPQGNQVYDHSKERQAGRNLGEITSTVPDLRDNRDPRLVADSLTTERAGAVAHTNGHSDS